MTTDRVQVKEDKGADVAEGDQKPLAPGADNPSGGARQPLQPQQRVETQTPGPDIATDDDVGLTVGNKGKSPGNGG